MNALFEFSEFVKFPLKCFKFLGLNPLDESKMTRKLIMKRIFYYFIISNMALFVIMAVMYTRVNFGNLALITENVPAFGYTAVACFKVLSISLGKREFKELEQTLSELFPKTKAEQDAARVKNYLSEYKRVERTFSRLIVFILLIFTVAPVLKFIISGVWIDKLPLEMWFPFDEYNPFVYNFVFVWELYIVQVGTILALLGADMALYGFIALISMEFEVLCGRLIGLKKVSPTDTFGSLIELIEFHVTLTRLSGNLERIYSFSIVINFLSSSLLICLFGYQFSIGVSFEILVKFAFSLMAALSQILLFCYYGNKLTSASEQVATAAYDCLWYDGHSRKFKTALQMMIQHAQKPSVITAFKFTPVSLEAFATVRIFEINRTNIKT